MKVKGLISTFLALAISAGLCVSAAADGAYVNNTNDNGFVIISDNDMRAKTVVADYDVNGRLVNAFTKAVDLKKHDNTFTYDGLGVLGISANRKTMVWNEDGIEPADKTRAAVDMATDTSNYVIAYVEEADITDGLGTLWFGASSTGDYRLKLLEGRKYSFTLNGKAITADEVKVGDVVTIKCDEDMSLDDLDSCEITVSRNAVDGKVISYNTDEDIYTLDNGESYTASGMFYDDLELGTSYRLYLDAFGAIAYAEEIVDYGNIGIVEELYSLDGVYSVDIIDVEGKKNNYVITEDDYAELEEILYPIFTKDSVTGRVISYNISDDGEFVFNQNFDGETGKVVDYSSETSKAIGKAKNLMLHDYDTVTPITTDDLEEGQQYKAWYYGCDIDGVYQLVLLYEVKKITLDLPMAICVSDVSDDDGKYTAKVYVNGEIETMSFESVPNISIGDSFFYTKNDDGAITAVISILKGNMSTYVDLYTEAVENNLDMVNDQVTENLPQNNELVFGIITEFYDSTSDEIVMATKDTVTDLTEVDIYSDIESYDISDAVVIYNYNCGDGSVTKGNSSSLRAMRIPSIAYVDDDIVDFTDSIFADANSPDEGLVKLALLRIVDDEVVEAYVIIPE